MNCANCKYWEGDTSNYDEEGVCTKMSAPEGEEYPDTDETGISATPLCIHDGPARKFETKGWFGCIHQKDK